MIAMMTDSEILLWTFAMGICVGIGWLIGYGAGIKARGGRGHDED